MRFGYSISDFIQEEWIVVIFIVAGFKFELLVFCLATERLEFSTVVFRWWVVWESLGYIFATSGKSETSTLFTFKCRIGLAEGFPVILRTIVQTFFIEVRLLILDTKECQDLGLVDFIVRLVLARMIRKFSILAGVGDVFTFRVAFLLLRMEFMHSSFSQTVWRFFDRGLLLGIVLLAILVRMSVKCSMGSSKSSE